MNGNNGNSNDDLGPDDTITEIMPYVAVSPTTTTKLNYKHSSKITSTGHKIFSTQKTVCIKDNTKDINIKKICHFMRNNL